MTYVRSAAVHHLRCRPSLWRYSYPALLGLQLFPGPCEGPVLFQMWCCGRSPIDNSHACISPRNFLIRTIHIASSKRAGYHQCLVHRRRRRAAISPTLASLLRTALPASLSERMAARTFNICRPVTAKRNASCLPRHSRLCLRLTPRCCPCRPRRTLTRLRRRKNRRRRVTVR